IGGFTVLVPRSVEARLGAMVADVAAPAERRVTGTEADRARGALERRLFAYADPDWQYRLEWVRSEQVNALAAPGGHMVAYCGLVQQMETADELSAVLAHEAAHVMHRHGMRNLIRTAGVRLLLSAMGADILVDSAAMLGALHYMRSDEEAAYKSGLQLLVKAGIDPAAMASAFGRLRAGAPDVPKELSYISTHPALEERRRAAAEFAKEVGQGGFWRPVMSRSEWMGLRNACSVP
ncbi:MAG TPA: M48 family metallopeptidase, partial [Bryobacteraceae bacterium]|nr:M48 family metallopeptidase [Bryobacteraceae bacterium]